MRRAHLEIDREVDAKKEVIAAVDVWPFISKAKTIHVASGQKVLSYAPGKNNREELIKLCTGRTGNLRAPAVKIGTEIYVGFSALMYEKLGACRRKPFSPISTLLQEN